MRKFLYKLSLFMQNRYTKVDSISWTAIIIGLIIGMFNVFIPNVYVRLAFELLRLAFMAYALWRPFSKAVWKRDRENRYWRKVLIAIKNYFVFWGRKIKYAKTSVFAVCPNCNARIKLPRKRGKHKVRCPRCQHRFDIKIYFGKK